MVSLGELSRALVSGRPAAISTTISRCEERASRQLMADQGLHVSGRVCQWPYMSVVVYVSRLYMSVVVYTSVVVCQWSYISDRLPLAEVADNH